MTAGAAEPTQRPKRALLQLNYKKKTAVWEQLVQAVKMNAGSLVADIA